MAEDGNSVNVDVDLKKLAVQPKEVCIRLRSGDGRPLASATVNGQPAKVLPGDVVLLPVQAGGNYKIEGKY